jgi:hypothetical protein
MAVLGTRSAPALDVVVGVKLVRFGRMARVLGEERVGRRGVNVVNVLLGKGR